MSGYNPLVKGYDNHNIASHMQDQILYYSNATCYFHLSDKLSADFAVAVGRQHVYVNPKWCDTIFRDIYHGQKIGLFLIRTLAGKWHHINPHLKVARVRGASLRHKDTRGFNPRPYRERYKWVAVGRVGKRRFLGYYNTREEAIERGIERTATAIHSALGMHK